MKAVIKLDVPEWQIGQDVSVYFPDTMLKHGKCELLKEQEAVKPKEGTDPNESHWDCGACGYPLWEDENYCAHYGKPVLWEGR